VGLSHSFISIVELTNDTAYLFIDDGSKKLILIFYLRGILTFIIQYQIEAKAAKVILRRIGINVKIL